jgi:hypothetical protein
VKGISFQTLCSLASTRHVSTSYLAISTPTPWAVVEPTWSVRTNPGKYYDTQTYCLARLRRYNTFWIWNNVNAFRGKAHSVQTPTRFLINKYQNPRGYKPLLEGMISTRPSSEPHWGPVGFIFGGLTLADYTFTWIWSRYGSIRRKPAAAWQLLVNFSRWR